MNYCAAARTRCAAGPATTTGTASDPAVATSSTGATKSKPTSKNTPTASNKETTMTSPYVDAFMLGYIKAALKEQINPNEVDALFEEAERFARSSIREREQSETE